MSSVPTPINYDVLWQNTVSTLNSLSHLRISWFRIKHIPGGEVVVGGFGDVEQAKLRTLFGSETVIALKKLRPDGHREQRIRVIASLARELSVWSKLNHPNILSLEGFYLDESSLTMAWIATPWQKNGNLKKYLATLHPDLNTRLKLALDTARGLAYLHNLSPAVCHGDIKAENAVIDDDGNARLCDFGLAKVLEDVPSGLTTTTTAGRTLRYAAPELASSGGSSHTVASDIWAWGCLLLIIITDLLPYHNDASDMAILRSIIDDRLPADVVNLRIPAIISLLLNDCWKKEPEMRLSMSRCAESLYDQALTRRSPLLNLSSYPDVDDPQGRTVAMVQWKAWRILDDISEILERFRVTGYLSDLLQAIELYRSVTSMWLDGSFCITQLATMVVISDLPDNDDLVLNYAIDWLLQALDLFPRNVKVSPRIAYHLSICLGHRHNLEGNIADLDLAIQHCHETLTLLPISHPFRSSILGALSLYLYQRWNHSASDITDLDNAVQHTQHALCFHEDAPYKRARHLQRLSEALTLRFIAQGNPADFEDASRSCQKTLELVAGNHYSYPILLHAISVIHGISFLINGAVEDLERLHTYVLQALVLVPVGHSRRPFLLHALSEYHLIGYKAKGQLSDLTQAIGPAQEALNLLPDRHALRPSCLSSLGRALHSRFLATNQSSDLDLAIQCGRDGIAHLTATSRLRPSVSNLLASALKSRYILTNDESDLDDAIKYGQELLTLSATDREERSTALTTLASCLTSRYKARADPFDREQASKYQREAQDPIPAKRGGRMPVLNRLLTLWRGSEG